MTEPILVPLLTNLAASLIWDSTKAAVGRLIDQSPIAGAIDGTTAAFSGIEDLHYTLRHWCETDEFQQLLKRLREGERDLTDNDVIDSFIQAGGFFAGESTRAIAENIITTFFHNLVDELYSSKKGIAVYAQREEALHKKSHDSLERIESTLGAFIAVPKQIQIVQPVSSDDIESHPVVRERIFHARVDEARELLVAGKPMSAKSNLWRLRNELAEQSPSVELLFRIATNLGICALELGDTNTARKEFEFAVRLQPMSSKACANAALAELIGGAPEKALTLLTPVLNPERQDPQVVAVYFQVLYRLGRLDEIDQLLNQESWIAENATCTLVLGQLNYDGNKYTEAEHFLRKSLQYDAQNPRTLQGLAVVLISSIKEAWNESPPLPWRRPEETLSRLREAEQLLTTAIGILEQHESRPQLHEALANRSGIRGLLGDMEGTLRDCNRVLVEDEGHAVALRNKGLILLKQDQPTEAIQCFEKISLADERTATALPLASAYLETGHPTKAIEILAPVWELDRRDHQQIWIADHLLDAHTRLGNTGDIAAILQVLTDRWPSEPKALVMVARQRRREENIVAATDLLREAISYASGAERDFIALDLADLYYDYGRYAEAAEMYGSIVDTNTDSDLLRKYLVALLYAGAYQEALTLAQELRGSGNAIPVISEVEAFVRQYIGDLDGACALWLQLSQADPGNVTHRIRVVMVYLRQGHEETAREALGQIRVDEIRNNAAALIQVAQARAQLGLAEVLPLAYRARRLDFNNPDIHLAYIDLFLRREIPDRALLEPTVVEADCTVHLVREGEKKSFTIVNEPIVDPRPGELTSTSPLALKLLGRRKGDRVMLREGPIEELAYIIADIQHKYVAAFQESMNDFSTWFPDNPALFRVEVRDHDLSKILAMHDARQQRTTQVFSLYRGGSIPLGMFARLVGSSLVSVWAGMTGRPDGRMRAANGTTEEAKNEAELLAVADALVLDLTALLTLAHLNLLNHLSQRFTRLVVARAVLDEIVEILIRDFSGPAPVMTTWKEGNRYVRQDITPESMARGRGFLERIRTFVESRAEVVPATKSLELGKTEYEQLEESLGQSGIASILVAKEHGVLLYADDLGLREVAKNDWQVEGVWSQAVLLHLHEHQILSIDQYFHAIKELALANYYFVSVNADHLMWLLRQNDMQITNQVMRMFALLHGPECNEESAIRVMTDLIRLMWFQVPLYQQKLLILDLALNTLTMGRPGSPVLVKLKIALGRKFALAPLVLRAIIPSIDLWDQRRLLRGGLFQS